MTASEAWLPRIARRGKGSQPSRASFETALLAVDITGFTRLTDRLEREGEAGVEEVASLLNDRFGEVIDAVVMRGGDVLRFAGDALVAGWLYGGDERERLRLAVEAALAIQEAVARRQDGLELRCGVALGALRCLHLGESQRAFVAAGPVLRDAHAAESMARPGNLVLAPSAALLLRGELEGATIEGSYFRVDGLSPSPFHRLRRADPPDPTTATLPTTEDFFRSYLHKVVQERLAAGQADWMAELRPLTVAFLSLPLDPDDPALPDRVLRTCQQVVARYEGTIDKLLCDEKGTAILMAWGLPPWAHPDNPVRAVRACTELIAALSGFLPGVCGGITTGNAFCGPVGNDKRREYTIIGSTVNLAARLMQASQKEHDLLCDSATVNACRKRLTFDPRPGVLAKGFAEAIPVWRPNPQRSVSIADLPPLIGRSQECEQLRQWLRDAPSPDPSGRVLVVEGERGVGKGRVLSQALEEAEAMGLQVLSAGADAIEHDTPYFPWRRMLLQLVPDQDPEVLLRLKEDVGDLELRSARIRERVLQLLEPHSRLLLIVEDAHEVDSASWGLLLHVVHSVRHLRVLTARRPDGRALPPKAEALLSDAPRLLLGPLDRVGTHALLCLRLNCSSVAEDLLDAIHQKAQGNPFFSEQLVGAFRDSGLLSVRQGRATLHSMQGLVIPDTLKAAILTRLDRLDPADLLLLKIASVAGPAFPLPLLSAIHPIASDIPTLPQRLGKLCAREILLPDVAGYRFAHPLTRDVAYEGLLQTQRRGLHAAAAAWLEKQAEPNDVLLSWHHIQAGNPARAIDGLERAGNRAMLLSAPREAADHYSRALELAPDQPASRRAHWARQVGEAWFSLGDLARSQQSLNQALVLLGETTGPKRVVIRLLREVAVQFLHRLWEPAIRPKAEVLEAALALDRLSELHFFTASALQSLWCSFRALNLADTQPPSEVRVRALATVGGSLGGAMTLHRAARSYLDDAQRLALRLDAPAAGAWVELLTALYLNGRGMWKEAAQGFSAAAQTYRELGALRRQEECYHHLGSVWVATGALELAREVYEDLEALARRCGDVQALAWAQAGLGEVALREGKSPDNLEAVLAQTRRCGDRLEEGKVLGLLAYQQPEHDWLEQLLDLSESLKLAFFHGGFDLAVEGCAALPASRRATLAPRLQRQLRLLRLTQPAAGPTLERLNAQILAAGGRRAQAQAAAQKSLEQARDLKMTLAEKQAEELIRKA